MNITVIKKTCKCGAEFEVPDTMFLRSQPHCPKCAEQWRAAYQAREAEKKKLDRIREWGNICPKQYLTIDRTGLPNPAKLDEVMAWKLGPRGLLLCGSTRTGKSRCAWTLAQREFLAGHSVKSLDSTAGILYASMYGDGPDLIRDHLNELTGCRILLLDDVFKNKLTDSFEGFVFSVIDQRVINNKPIIATINDTPASLALRMSADRANPLILRLREFCQDVQF